MRFSQGLNQGFVFVSILLPALASAAIYDRAGNKLPDTESNSREVNWEPLSIATAGKRNGVGVVRINRSWCSGTLIAQPGSANDPKASAYVVTNGHCIGGGLPDPGEIIAGAAPRVPNYQFHLNFYRDSMNKVRRIDVKRIAYATMKSTDIAVLELAIPLQQLRAEGFHPIEMATTALQPGEKVENIGNPVSGMRELYMRRSTCEAGATVNFREGDFHFEGANRHRCSIMGGSSGSPLISLETGRLVAVVNTAVDDEPGEVCSLDHPCEVAADGTITMLPQENYAQRTFAIPSCFDPMGAFDLSLTGCQLEKP